MSDLISREETYKTLCEEYPLLQKEYLRRVIDEVPSAERKGHWIYPYESTNMIKECAECGARYGNRFCPNCGAKMEGEEE